MRARPGCLGAFFPEPDDELLLHAAIDDDAAAAAWGALTPRFDLDAVTWAQYRLIPLLARNLVQRGIDSPDLERMQGVRRRTWSENQLRLRDTAAILSVLAAADVSTLLLKGVALVTADYDDVGVRPMLDTDILVNDRPRALAALAPHGWAPREDWRRAPPHGMPLSDPTGRAIDVHAGVSGLVIRGRGTHSWDDLWDVSSPTVVGQVETRLPDPADLLLHVCVHGSQRREESSLQWVADATTVMRSSTIDWERLVQQAQLRHAVVAATETLTYLSSEFSAPVPPEILERLHATRVSRRDSVVYRSKSGLEFGGRPLRLPARIFWNYARASADRTTTGAIIGVAPHLARRLWERGRERDVESLAQAG